MATRYSDHFSTSGDDGDSLDTQIRASAGISHGRIRYKRAQATGLFLTSDTVRMMTFKSGDRLLEMWLASDGTSAAGAVDVGLSLTGSNHDGALVDVDLFGTAIVTSTAMERSEALVEAALAKATTVKSGRGLPLWEAAAIGAGSDTSDPGVQYDILLTPTTSFTSADSIITLEAYYTSGD